MSTKNIHCAGCAFDDRDDEKGCRALRRREYGECRFKKTPDELAASKAKAIERLNGLPEEQQEHISKEYYIGGWCE
jgi:hypothetical protein